MVGRIIAPIGFPFAHTGDSRAGYFFPEHLGIRLRRQNRVFFGDRLSQFGRNKKIGDIFTGSALAGHLLRRNAQSGQDFLHCRAGHTEGAIHIEYSLFADHSGCVGGLLAITWGSYPHHYYNTNVLKIA